MNRAVALIHGWGGSGAATWVADGWDEALGLAGFQPVLVDLPGHGPAGGSCDPADYADLASDLAAILRKRAPEGLFAAIGFSLGTKLLLELEARAPGSNGRLILGGIGDNIFAPEGAGPALIAALRGESPAPPPAIQALMTYAAKSGSDPRCLAAVLQRPANPRLDTARLHAARQGKDPARILLVNSRDDSVAMPDAGLRAAIAPEYLQLDGSGHIGLTSDRRFRQAALDFLGRA